GALTSVNLTATPFGCLKERLQLCPSAANRWVGLMIGLRRRSPPLSHSSPPASARWVCSAKEGSGRLSRGPISIGVGGSSSVHDVGKFPPTCQWRIHQHIPHAG